MCQPHQLIEQFRSIPKKRNPTMTNFSQADNRWEGSGLSLQQPNYPSPSDPVKMCVKSYQCCDRISLHHPPCALLSLFGFTQTFFPFCGIVSFFSSAEEKIHFNQLSSNGRYSIGLWSCSDKGWNTHTHTCTGSFETIGNQCLLLRSSVKSARTLGRKSVGSGWSRTWW